MKKLFFFVLLLCFASFASAETTKSDQQSLTKVKKPIEIKNIQHEKLELSSLKLANLILETQKKINEMRIRNQALFSGDIRKIELKTKPMSLVASPTDAHGGNWDADKDESGYNQVSEKSKAYTSKENRKREDIGEVLKDAMHKAMVDRSASGACDGVDNNPDSGKYMPKDDGKGSSSTASEGTNAVNKGEVLKDAMRKTLVDRSASGGSDGVDNNPDSNKYLPKDTGMKSGNNDDSHINKMQIMQNNFIRHDVLQKSFRSRVTTPRDPYTEN